jgi:hypothetical protein
VTPSSALRNTAFPFIVTSFLTFIVVGVCAAPVSAPEPPRGERGRLAQVYLEKKLAHWQKRLDLKDWQITLELADTKVLRAGSLGNIHWDLPSKTARIRVLDASEYKSTYDAAVRDMEFTIVHELIHLDFASLPRDDESRKDEEKAVNRMATALLRLDRHE